MRTRFGLLCLAGVAALALSATGCDEISARRKVQEANAKYKNGRYEEARDLYEAALKQSPELTIAHHNLGVTYYRLMARGDDSPENQAIANKATEHLLHFLQHGGSEEKEKVLIRKLVTEIWVDSAQVDKALAFWEGEHQGRPKDTSVLEQLADLNYKKGDWRKAIEWLEKSVAVAETPDTKASAHGQIATLCFLRLLSGKDTIQGAERIALADTGIGAIQKALALQPKNMQFVSTLASLNQQRSFASGSRIGFHIDLAAHQNHMRVFKVLQEEAKKQAAENPPAEPGKGG
jgi:tetratricopeptide (TPR) repeat protein